ncbi:MAG TPA: HNH endonuclease signature motif containing protein [Streptosporangiaceae bacterium]|jgi:5-methylcytosine-specific restriction protein A
MARRAWQVCSTPECPELTEQGGRCASCKRDADRARGSGTARGYTKRWATFRKHYLGEHPVCECGPDCCPGGCGQLATDIDHRDGSGRNGPRAYDETNLQALAHGCHSRKTARFDGSFGR